MRVSQMTFYRITSQQVSRYQSELAKLNEQIATQKQINRPSDNAINTITVYNSHVQQTDITQYFTNLDHAQSWLEQADSDFGNMTDVMTQVRALAEQMATGTMDAANRQIAGNTAFDYISDFIQFANSEIAGSHIYSGSATASSALQQELKVDDMATASTTNTGSGSIYGMGTYEGFMSRTITLEATATPNEFNVSYVDDYGRARTGTVTLAASGAGNAVEICDGVEIYIDAGSFSAGDTYTLNVGRQTGNTDDLYANLSWDNRLRYNYTPDEFYGEEGNDGSGWNNILDILANWSYYLSLDGQEHDYFEAVPNVNNDPTHSGNFQVSGDWDTLEALEYQFNIGGPIQSDASAADRAHFTDFSVDASWSGGKPSASNPMIINYTYDGAFGGVPAGNYQITITGTGPDASFALCDGGVDITLAEAAYYNTDPTWQLTSAYDDSQPPSATNPMEVTYTYLDDFGVRQKATATFTGTGDDTTISLEPSGNGITVSLSEDGTFGLFDRWDLTLQQYNQGQSRSQEAIEELEQAMNNLLKYRADAGAKLNRLDVRTNFFTDDELRIEGRFSRLEDLDVATATAEWNIQMTMYEAALQATAMVSSVSLANYI